MTRFLLKIVTLEFVVTPFFCCKTVTLEKAWIAFEKSTKCTSVALLRLSPDLLGDSPSEKGPANKKIGRETQNKRKFRRESIDGELKI